MERLHETDLSPATYRSRDPIKNLKIKVTLKRLSASTVGFQPALPEDDQHTLAVNQFGQTVLEEEELTLHWQKKFFSQREIDFYGFEPNCTSVADYKYHAEVENIKNRDSRPNKRIFTYLNNDRFSVAESVCDAVTTSKDEEPSKLASQITELRRRKADQQPTISPWELQKGKTQTGLKMVEAEPSDEFKANHHLLNTPVQTYTIMLDLSPEGQLGSAEFERPLCTLEYDDNFVLRVNPDFTNAPCRLQETGLTRDVWEFTLTNASAQVSKLEAKREAKVISEMYRKHQAYLKGLVGDEFEEIPPHLFRLFVTGEIVSAESFEYDHLHVEYFLDLPSLWTCDSTLFLSGCTHSCKTSLHCNKEVAYFSHPFEYQAFLDLNEDEGTLEWPKMFIQVISMDTWGRRRTEGYGYFILPTTPGPHEVCIQCWRPSGNAGYASVLSQLKRYFVGGNPELEEVRYTALPSTFEGKRVSKYGVRCASGGCVRVRLNCVQQCQGFRSEASRAISKKKWQSALLIAKGRANEAAIYGILEAYHRARKRMLQAREKVPSQTRLDAERTAKEKLRQTTFEDKIDRILAKAAQKKDE